MEQLNMCETKQATDQDRREFVAAKMGAGWSKGAIKAALRKQFGPQPNADLEGYLRDAKERLAVAVESDAAMTTALDLYRRWTAIHNVVNGQLISRERLHRALKIPPPAEMLRLERDWGTNAPPPAKAIETVETLLADLKTVIASVGH